MIDRNYRDIVAGIVISLLGAAATLYALSNYATGTITRMGPGMVPTALGAILLVLGLLIAAPAFAQRGEWVTVRYRPLVMITASILSFALMIRGFGLVPSVFAATVISTFAERKVSLRGAVILAGAVSLMTWTIFSLGLGVGIPAFDWPF